LERKNNYTYLKYLPKHSVVITHVTCPCNCFRIPWTRHFRPCYSKNNKWTFLRHPLITCRRKFLSQDRISCGTTSVVRRNSEQIPATIYRRDVVLLQRKHVHCGPSQGPDPRPSAWRCLESRSDPVSDPNWDPNSNFDFNQDLAKCGPGLRPGLLPRLPFKLGSGQGLWPGLKSALQPALLLVHSYLAFSDDFLLSGILALKI